MWREAWKGLHGQIRPEDRRTSQVADRQTELSDEYRQMIQADAMVREDVHTLRIIASLVIYAVLMLLGLITVIVGILMHGGWHDDGPSDSQIGTGQDAGRAEVPPGTAQREGQDAE